MARVRDVRIEEVPADRSLVVFLRPDSGAWNLSVSLMDGEEWISVLMTHTHVLYETTPGRHRFQAFIAGERPFFLDGDLEPRKVYFVAFRGILNRWGFIRYDFVPITPESEQWEKLPSMLSDSDQVIR